jgi:tetratricopeptide (TPR) repeat protein
LALYEQLVGEHPHVPQYRQELASTHNNLGLVLVQIGQAKEGRANLEKAIALLRDLVREAPQVPEYRLGLARCLFALAICLAVGGETDQARDAAKEALELLQKLVKDHPELADAQRLLKVTEGLYRGLGGK